MQLKCKYSFVLTCITIVVLIQACNTSENSSKPPMFQVLTNDLTGLNFINKLTPTQNFNMFNYMYFYNGSGVAAGDFNNDGLIDVFFAANQVDNKMYINEGSLHFKDVTTLAAIPQDNGWSTGVSVLDINNDGMLDIYICRVGNYEVLKAKNQLLICKDIKNGIPIYRDEATQYGIAFSSFSTQAAFFDFDKDGDIDMYLLNHSIHQNSSYGPRSNFLGTYDALAGDKLLRNDGGIFTDVTKQSNINSSTIGYGLGIAVSDINMDGWPDIYIGNDFHENDYIYINQKNGTFIEVANQQLMHTSKFSMGVDVADANNDGYPEIISLDMLPEDPYILKRSLGDDDYDIFYNKISFGYSYQYARNNLQFNTKNGLFSEVGLYAGVAATDWSWAPLWMDFDNDGLKDLFISNGIPKRLNDMDYINFIYNSEIQQKIQNKKMQDKDLELTKKFPEIKIKNKFYKNNRNLTFTDETAAIKNDKVTYSNGAIYADFDNDGDEDIIVNNIDDPALLYENTFAKKGEKNYTSIHLKGPEKNINAIGAKVVLFVKDSIRTYEKIPVRGFMSSMETPIHIGLYNTIVDSAVLIWPDNSFEKMNILVKDSAIVFTYKKGLPIFNYTTITNFKPNTTNAFEDITDKVGIDFLHKENSFNEFDREPLIPHMLSTEGPALAVADINNDGLQDVFIGAAKTFNNAIYLQQANGKFIKTVQPQLALDSMYEDVDAKWVDVNNDGFVDLVVASGGNEYYGNDDHLLPRVYINDGKANFKKLIGAFSNIFVTTSCILPYDFNADGFIDLFIGGRAVPWNYGEVPTSFLLKNDGTGKFIDVTSTVANEVSKIGLVTNAAWADIDNDKDSDLIVTCEWGGIYAFINSNANFVKKEITDKKGWWNFVLPVDIDNDGDMDFIAGNLGLNSRLKASENEPVKLYFNDFDDNGKKEQILSYYLQGKEIPFSSKDELQKQIPLLKKKYFYAADFAKADFKDVFSKEKLENANVLTADYFANAILINNGNMHFSTQALPWQAQLSTYRDAAIIQANNDAFPDILFAANYFSNNIHNGRYDADFGTVLVNKGAINFTVEQIKNISIKGEARHIVPIQINKKPAFIVAKNNDKVLVFKYKN